MDAQVSECLHGNKLNSRIAINKIHLFSSQPNKESINPLQVGNANDGVAVGANVFE